MKSPPFGYNGGLVAIMQISAFWKISMDDESFITRIMDMIYTYVLRFQSLIRYMLSGIRTWIAIH